MRKKNNIKTKLKGKFKADNQEVDGMSEDNEIVNSCLSK